MEILINKLKRAACVCFLRRKICLRDWDCTEYSRRVIFRPTPPVLVRRICALFLSAFALATFWLSFGPPWITWETLKQQKRAPLEQAQLEDLRILESLTQELIERHRDWMPEEKWQQIQLQHQQRTKNLREQRQRTITVFEIIRQLILWPSFCLFGWLAGWFGLVGILSYPVDLLTIRRIRKNGEDYLIIAKRNLFGTTQREQVLTYFSHLTWCVRAHTAPRSRTTTWYGLLVPHNSFDEEMEFALVERSGVPERYDRPPKPVQKFLTAVSRLTALPIEQPQVKVRRGLFGTPMITTIIPTGRKIIFESQTFEELPPQIRKQVKDPR
ncbi:MAG: hypothetical protein KatS3mg114_0139 [Planctomycetaceae bacterium]|nr:MAG: hypothetical protein KatS3mg114_0139 [Planctomycetaceae bacterium]